MDVQAHTRFKGAPWYGQKHTCFIGGLGSIGSWLSLFLARAGHNLVLCDRDKVDIENLAGQLYPANFVGLPKVTALADVVTSLCDIQGGKQVLSTIYGSAEDVVCKTHMVFSCFDNITIRRTLFNSWLQYLEANPKLRNKAIFIDGRLAAESYEVFVCRYTTREIKKYQESLWKEEEVAPEVCSYKATTHVSAAIAYDMVRVFNNHLSNLKHKKNIRHIPLYIFSEAMLMSYECN